MYEYPTPWKIVYGVFHKLSKEIYDANDELVITVANNDVAKLLVKLANQHDDLKKFLVD